MMSYLVPVHFPEPTQVHRTYNPDEKGWSVFARGSEAKAPSPCLAEQGTAMYLD